MAVNAYNWLIYNEYCSREAIVSQAHEENIENKKQVDKELELLRSEIEALRSMSFIQKLRWLFR